MDNKKIVVVSLAASIISLISLIITPNSLNGAQIFTIIGILFAIIGIILGFISKKKAKGLAITSIIIATISFIVLCFTLIGIIGIEKATNCVDKGNGLATCYYMGQEIEIPTSYLTEEQMKK